MSDENGTQDREHHVDLSWEPVAGGFVATPQISPGEASPEPEHDAHAEQPPAQGLAHPFAAFALIVLGIATLCVAVTGGWFAMSVTHKVRVPVVQGMVLPQASAALSGAQLGDGNAYYLPTREFPPHLIVRQVPPAGVEVSQNASIDVGVAIEPTQQPVPDLGLAEAANAVQALRYAMFTPRMLYAYSKDVATGLVMEQLPRAGDLATTGSSDVLVVSLGPGTGKSVPSVVGQTFADAATQLSGATLFPEVKRVVDNSVPAGTVVDQAPGAGSLVPVASDVTVSIAISAQ